MELIGIKIAAANNGLIVITTEADEKESISVFNSEEEARKYVKKLMGLLVDEPLKAPPPPQLIDEDEL